MSLLQLDVSGATDQDFDQLVQLDGVEYLFRFQWMTREACWYLGIYDQDENALATWIKVVVSWDLLRRRRVREQRLPRGLLYAVDTTGAWEDIKVQGDLGSRVPLMYLTADDSTIANAHVDVVMSVQPGFTVGAGRVVLSEGGDPRLAVTWSNENDISTAFASTTVVTVSFVASVSGRQSLPARSLAIVGTYDAVKDVVIPGTYAGVNSVSNPQQATPPKVTS